MKCDICKTTLGETFLKKIKGTYIKNSKGKQFAVCFDCQKKFQKKEDVLAQLQK